ncbi:ferric reductase NAD binding domain-containing protein [Chaetomium sp. MPI-CAGE-AT-0009]|nr:ferric reductase NAD binding domain-containing protein [Chaetomium sp. MPI-CAGE-AT-0009]
MAGSSANPLSGGEHGGAGQATGVTHADTSHAMEAYFAQRQVMIERVMKYYAAGICGLIAVFVLFHWARWFCVKVERSNKPRGAFSRPFVASSRFARNLLVRKVPGFKSAGHALVIMAYVAITLAVTFTNIDVSSMGTLAHRFGWLSLANMALLVFLALKNTPLAFLTAYSYERLNCLHQIAGCAMFIAMLLHGALYTAFFDSTGRLVSIYHTRSGIAAIVSGFAFLSVVFSALVLRRFWYELFYVTHVSSWIIAVIALSFHRPEIANKSLIVILLAVSMWFVDRVIRAGRILYYSANNGATLHPLPDGSTKIVMKKVPARAEPGKHCFIWIPAIRKFETHPFTIHGSSPVEFTVKARNGFTSDLYKHAVANPGAVVRASIDGPYGTFPNPMEFDKIVLIAGGGGATFTFGLAVNVLERMDEGSPKNIVFVWSVKKHENLSWFKEQLELLRTHAHSPKVNVSLYVTRAPTSTSDLPSENESSEHVGHSDSSSDGADSPPLSPAGSDLEKNTRQTTTPARWQSLSHGSHAKEMGSTIETQVKHSGAVEEKSTTGAEVVSHTFFEYPVKTGRPDAASLIRDAVTTTPRNQRVLVAACGPDGLMHVVRDTTAKLIVGDGPAVELHCEQFGW